MTPRMVPRPMSQPGTDFEAAVKRSFGTAGKPDPDGVYVWKIPDPPVRRPEQVSVAGGAQAPRFTIPNPFDFLIVSPRWIFRHPLSSGGSGPTTLIPDGSYTLALECKSTAEPRLDFSVLWSRSRGELRPIQRDALASVARAGGNAGVLWECRRGSPQDPLYTLGGSSSAVFIPIAIWIDHEANLGRKSLPWAVAVRDGIVVERDAGRGTKKPYWRMPELLKRLRSPVPEPLI